MIYEYHCVHCGEYFDVVKAAALYDREEVCEKCGLLAFRQFSSRIQLAGTSVQDAEYNPGLGCIVRNKQHRKELCRSRGLTEIGSEPVQSLHNTYDKERSDRRERGWADTDKGWVGSE